jgi:hypothetical protein
LSGILYLITSEWQQIHHHLGHLQWLAETVQNEYMDEYFPIKCLEDCYLIKKDNIKKAERTLYHLQQMGNSKSNYLRSVFVYTIFISKSISSLFAFVSLFVNFTISAEYFQILLLASLFELLGIIYSLTSSYYQNYWTSCKLLLSIFMCVLELYDCMQKI